MEHSPFAEVFTHGSRFAQQQGEPVEMSVHVGELKVPTGRLCASDPFTTSFDEKHEGWGRRHCGAPGAADVEGKPGSSPGARPARGVLSPKPSRCPTSPRPLPSPPAGWAAWADVCLKRAAPPLHRPGAQPWRPPCEPSSPPPLRSLSLNRALLPPILLTPQTRRTGVVARAGATTDTTAGFAPGRPHLHHHAAGLQACATHPQAPRPQQPLQQLLHPDPRHRPPLPPCCPSRPCPYRVGTLCKVVASAGSEGRDPRHLTSVVSRPGPPSVEGNPRVLQKSPKSALARHSLPI
jgi:hypothetical protein